MTKLKLEQWKPLDKNTIQSIQNIGLALDRIGMVGYVAGQFKLDNSNKIESMAPICFNLTKKVGDTVHMLARPASGTAPYTVTFKKGADTSATLLKQVVNISEGQMITYDYIITNQDAGLTQTFSVITDDSCPNGSQQGVESCNVSVEALPAVCNPPKSNLVIT